MDEEFSNGGLVIDAVADSTPIRVLLLDDQVDNLLLRSTILRKYGYLTETAGTIEEAEKLLGSIDIAVLDYHLGAGKFGTEVAEKLRRIRPEVPIIILSAVLERRFGGPEDMHLLKGYSSNDDLIVALRSFRSKLRGKPVVVDAREFFYSRIDKAMGDEVVLEILDNAGNWQYVNETARAPARAPTRLVPRQKYVRRAAGAEQRLGRHSLDGRNHARDLHRPYPARASEPSPQGRAVGLECARLPR